MNTQSVAALLADMPVKSVGDIDELAKIAEKGNLGLPALYVVSDSVTGAPPPEGSYILDQVLTSTVMVVIVTRPDGARQGNARALLDELRDGVLTRLFGAQPEGWGSVLTIADIRNVPIAPGLIGRAVRMRGRTHIRKTLTPA
jgi:hypothetical protein